MRVYTLFVRHRADDDYRTPVMSDADKGAVQAYRRDLANMGYAPGDLTVRRHAAGTMPDVPA